MSEVELKYEVPAGRRVDIVDAINEMANVQSDRLISIYFDTPDRALARHRVAVRLRFEGGRWQQTLKAAGDASIDRAEENVDRDGDWPDQGPPLDPDLHRGTVGGERLRAALADSVDPVLAPAFISDFIRRRADICHQDSLIELAFDEGELRGAGPPDGEDKTTVQPIRELELELKQGHIADLLAYGGQWVDRHGLWLNTISKAARGSLLAEGRSGPVPAKARIASLSRGDPISARALRRRWTAVCVEQVLDNASQLASEGGPLDAGLIHQLRVGIRRLRTVQRELVKAGGPGSKDWQAPVKALFDALGRVRDRDQVLARHTAAIVAAGGVAVDRRGAEPPPDVIAMIRSAPFQHAVLALLRDSLVDDQIGSHVAESEPDRRGIELVARRLDKLHRRVARAGKRFDTLSDAARHRARKRVKRLRYLVELSRPLFADRAVKAYLKRLKIAQRRLGDHQDLVTAGDAYRSAAQNGQAQAWFGAGWLQATRDRRSRGCRRASKQLAKADRFWVQRKRDA